MEKPEEMEVVIFRLDNHDYVLEQSVVKLERTMGILRQYFPDVLIIYGDEEVGTHPTTE